MSSRFIDPTCLLRARNESARGYCHRSFAKQLKCRLALFGSRGFFTEIFHKSFLNYLAERSSFFGRLAFGKPHSVFFDKGADFFLHIACSLGPSTNAFKPFQARL